MELNIFEMFSWKTFKRDLMFGYLRTVEIM
jgi:hypothetical protein